MLSDVTHILVDPRTQTPLTVSLVDGALVGKDSRWPIDPVGYVVFGAAAQDSGDSEAMVEAREICLSRGLFGPFVEAVTDAVHDALDDADCDPEQEPIIVDLGAGTGYYLAHTLDDVAGSKGIGIDISEPACTHLANCHRRVAALCSDATGKLPLADNSVDVVTVVFALHNPEECARILRPGGQIIALTALPGHLSELRAKVGIADVSAGVIDDLHTELAPRFEAVGAAEIIEFPIVLDHNSIVTQVTMSPSARSIDPSVLAERVAQLPEQLTVTARAAISRFRTAE